MLITTTRSVANSVYLAQLDVTLDALDTDYVLAYGEPQVDTSGTITYTPDESTPVPTPIAFDTSADVGAVPSPGSATYDTQLGAWVLSGSGTLPASRNDWPSFFRGTDEVEGEYQLTAQLADMDDQGTDGFQVGFVVWDGNDSDDPGVFFGWCKPVSGTAALELQSRAAAGGAATVVASYVLAQGRGVWLRLRRVGDVVTAYYSITNGITWVTLGAVTTSKLTYRVGMIVNSGELTVATAVLRGVEFVVPASSVTSSFTISGGPTMRFIRSQSPHQFQLDGKVDPNARAKVAGWATTIATRIRSAYDTLLANPNPTPDTEHD